MNSNKEKTSGFEDLDDTEWLKHERCINLGHNPPTHLHVPYGKRYRHVCPGCGYTVYLYGSSITFSVNN